MSTPETTYRQRAERWSAQEAELNAQSRRLSLLRLAVFVAIVASLGVILVRGGRAGWPWLVVVAGSAALFLGLVARHRKLERRRQRFAGLVEINREAIARLVRDWDGCPLPVPPQTPTEGAMARDLDLFGRASLFHLLGTVRSPPGRARLAGWLLEPAAPPEVVARQEAVRELAADLDLRQELELACRPLAEGQTEFEPFLRWAEGEPWLAGRPALLWWARAMALLTLPALLASLFGALPWPVAALFPLANLVVAYLTAQRTGPIFDHLDYAHAGFVQYAAAMGTLAGRAFQAPRLATASAVLTTPAAPVEGAAGNTPEPAQESAHRAMDRLSRLVVLADSRHGSYVQFFLQTLLLWDLHLLARFEHWQAGNGRRARGWLEALGEIEALAALGGLAHDNPEWSFAQIETGSPAQLTATGLGHPLLSPDQRVGNDVSIGPPGTFLLVTGSNMSGKSTLLRAVGVNVVLAQAGGPCCAEAIRLPPVVLGTSVLIEDSLADGYSFFMAELRRLKEIVELAGSSRSEESEGGQRTLLFLLDEILRGTNAPERQVAVRRVLLHLMRQGAIGAISTHDLSLAEVEDLAAAGHPVHFRETVHTGGEGPAMTFDYQLRDGVATTVNALKLLDLVGLPAEDSEGD